MVKMTIKRMDDATDKKWVCERIEDDLESDTKTETISQANKPLQVEGENVEDETEYAGNWYEKIPSYLEIEMKEGNDQQPSWDNSKENKTIYMTHGPISSHDTIENTRTSWDVPIDLSTSQLKRRSPTGIKNISHEIPIETHASKSKFLENPYTEDRNASSITDADRTIQNETNYFFPRPIWSQNISSMAPNTRSMGQPLMAQIAPSMAQPLMAPNVPSMAQPLMAPNIPPMSQPLLVPNTSSMKQSQMVQKAPSMAQPVMAPNAPSMAQPAMAPNAPSMAQPVMAPNAAAYWNYWNAYGMAMNGIHFPHYNFLMNPHGVFPVTNGPIHTDKSKISMQGNNAGNQKQEIQTHLKTNDKLFNTNTVDKDLCSKESYPKGQQSYDLPLQPEGSANTNTIKKMCTERTGDNSFNNLPQNNTNIRKRSSENCVQISDRDAYKLSSPPKKKQSRSVVENIATYCNVCKRQFRNQQGFDFHLTCKYHLKNLNKVTQQRPNLYLNSEGKSLESTNLQVQPRSNELQPFPNKKKCIIQAGAMTSTNQTEENVMKNNIEVQNSITGTSKTNYAEESSGQVRSQNLGKECYSQNQRPPNVTVRRNKSSRSSLVHKDSSIQNHPENSIEVSARNFPSTHSGEDFHIYHCKVCSVFQTNILQDLELHIYTDRTRTPLDLIIPFNNGLVCKLCHFQTEISEMMAQHCTSETHLNLVTYFNHVREGGLHRVENLDLTTFSPIRIFCSACECSIETMVTLKVHENTSDHQYNVSCCMYFASFSMTVNYCFCRLCNLRTLSKRDLLVHAKSEYHKNHLRRFPPTNLFRDPRNVFYIKELNMKTVPPTVSKQNAGKTSIRKNQPLLRKKSDEESNLVQDLASVNLDSPSTTSFQPQSISCCLCQQFFQAPGYLVKHLLQYHGVTKIGAEWIVSNTQKGESKESSEKSVPEEMPRDQKVKSNTFWPERSLPESEKSPTKLGGKDSVSQESVDTTERNTDSESSERSRDAQNAATDEDSNQNRTSYPSSAVSSSSQQFNETKRALNPEKLVNPHSTPYKQTCSDLPSNQKFNESERVQNPDLHQERRLNTNSALNQQLNETEHMQNSVKLDNPQSSSYGRPSIDLSSRQLINDQEHMKNPDKLDNSSSSLFEQTCLDVSSSQKFYETEDIHNSDLILGKRINIDSTSEEKPNANYCLDENFEYYSESDDEGRLEIVMNDTSSDETRNLSSIEENAAVLEERRNSNCSQDETTVEKDSEPIVIIEEEIEIADSSSDESKYLLPVKEIVPVADQKLNSNSLQDEALYQYDSEPIEIIEEDIETYDSSADEREYILPVEENFLIVNSNSTQLGTTVESDSKDIVNNKGEREMDDSSSNQLRLDDTGSLISLTALNSSIESIDSCSSDDSFERFPAEAKQVSRTGIRTVEYDQKEIVNNEDEGEMYDSSSDQLRSVDTDSQISLSVLNTSIESIDSCSSVDSCKQLPAKGKQDFGIGNGMEQDTLDTQNTKSPSECKRNQNLKQNVDKYVNDIMALVESKKESNNSSSILNHSVNDRMELNDLPERIEVYIHALSSPTTDSQMEAEENIENVEISNVFSLGCIDISNDDDDMDIYSGL